MISYTKEEFAKMSDAEKDKVFSDIAESCRISLFTEAMGVSTSPNIHTEKLEIIRNKKANKVKI